MRPLLVTSPQSTTVRVLAAQALPEHLKELIELGLTAIGDTQRAAEIGSVR